MGLDGVLDCEVLAVGAHVLNPHGAVVDTGVLHQNELVKLTTGVPLGKVPGGLGGVHPDGVAPPGPLVVIEIHRPLRRYHLVGDQPHRDLGALEPWNVVHVDREPRERRYRVPVEQHGAIRQHVRRLHGCRYRVGVHHQEILVELAGSAPLGEVPLVGDLAYSPAGVPAGYRWCRWLGLCRVEVPSYDIYPCSIRGPLVRPFRVRHRLSDAPVGRRLPELVGPGVGPAAGIIREGVHPCIGVEAHPPVAVGIAVLLRYQQVLVVEDGKHAVRSRMGSGARRDEVRLHAHLVLQEVGPLV